MDKKLDAPYMEWNERVVVDDEWDRSDEWSVDG